MNNEPVNISTLHAKIKEVLAAKYPTATVDFYPRPGDKIKGPAIFFELDDIEPDPDGEIGTEQLPIVLHFCAYVVLDYKQGNKLAVRLLAADLLGFVKDQRWDGSKVMPAEPLGMWPDKFKKENPTANENTEEYECFRVEWTNTGLLGADYWKDALQHPTEVFGGIDPRTGPDNYPEAYTEVTEGRI